MLKALCPVFTLVALALAKMLVPSLPLVASVLLISIGVVISSYGEVNFSWIGKSQVARLTCEQACTACSVSDETVCDLLLPYLRHGSHAGIRSSRSCQACYYAVAPCRNEVSSKYEAILYVVHICQDLSTPARAEPRVDLDC